MNRFLDRCSLQFGPQPLGADANLLLHTIDYDVASLKVQVPAAAGLAVREAHVIAEGWSSAGHLTLAWHVALSGRFAKPGRSHMRQAKEYQARSKAATEGGV